MSELSMSWVDPWVGSGWVSQLMGWVGSGHTNGPVDNSASCLSTIGEETQLKRGVSTQ